MLTPTPISCPAAGRTTYTEDQTSAYRQNSALRQGSALGEDRFRQSWEQFVVPPAGGVHNHRAIDIEAGRGTSTPMQRWIRWLMFASGHLVSAAIMLSVIALLTCFDEYLVPEDNDVIGGLEDRQSSQEVASSTKRAVFSALIFFFGADIFYAVILPVTCRSPMDLTSVHILPLGHDSFDSGHAHLLVTAPSMWYAIYGLGAAANQALSLNSSCERQGGSGLGLYITISGIVMHIVVFIFYWVSLVGVAVNVSSLLGCGGRWSSVAERIFRRHIVSKGLILDLFWKLQCVAWLYRVGGARMAVSVLLAMLSVVGAVLRTIGTSGTDLQHLVIVTGRSQSPPV